MAGDLNNKKNLQHNHDLHLLNDQWLPEAGESELANGVPFEKATSEDIEQLWQSNPEIHHVLKESDYLEQARRNLNEYLNLCLQKVFSADSDYHLLENSNIRECVRVFHSVIGPINEKRLQFSDLDVLWQLAHDNPVTVSRGFVFEFIHLFRGVIGQSDIYAAFGGGKKWQPKFLRKQGRAAALERSRMLDDVARKAGKSMQRFPSGLDNSVIRTREKNRQRITHFFNDPPDEWFNYKWHIRNVIRDASILEELVHLLPREREAIRLARANRIPFGITPYYVSLFDHSASRKQDHAVRAQVIPPLNYVKTMSANREQGKNSFDFMGEADTSPIDLITRRYPQIAIFKPINTCAQICVYCQRNWEIEQVLSPHALARPEQIDAAIQWFKDHPAINEVLITGGDPLVMNDGQIEKILRKFSEIDHIEQIRIGSRMPVVLPFRFTPSLLEILKKYHNPPQKNICLVTHFEHVYEITPEVQKAVTDIRRAGLSIYNQQVFTIENCRRFETNALRQLLRKTGVTPYYNFNAKGKEETQHYRVPVARILQERKEEGRLLPGITRTDEPVFNVPRLGKNHLRAWQDHRVVMIMPNGSRVYEFHPWEKNIMPVPSYYHYDVPIYDFLEELRRRGENPNAYRTIWYYY